MTTNLSTDLGKNDTMSESLHPGYQDILTENYHLFSRFLFADDFIDELISKTILSPNDKDKITNPYVNQTRRQRAAALIDVLLTKGPTGYDCFLEILEFQCPYIYKEVTKKDPRPLPKGYHRNRLSDRLLLLENLPNLAHHIKEQFKHNEELAMQLSVLEGLMTDSHDEKAEIEKELESLKKASTEKSKETAALKAQNIKLQEDVYKLHEDLRNEMERSHHIRDDRDILKQKLQEMQIVVDQQQQQNQSKKKQPEPMNHPNVQDLRDRHIFEQIKILKEQLEEQMQQTEEYVERLTQSESREIEQRKYIKTLKHSLKQADKEHEILNREKADLKKKNETYLQRIKEKNEELFMIEDQKREVEKKIQEVGREKEKLFEEKFMLEDQLQQARSELDRLNNARLSRSSQEMSSSAEEGQEEGIECPGYFKLIERRHYRRTNVKYAYNGSTYADRIKGKKLSDGDEDDNEDGDSETEDILATCNSNTLPTGSGLYGSPEALFQQEVAHLRWTMRERKPKAALKESESLVVHCGSYIRNKPRVKSNEANIEAQFVQKIMPTNLILQENIPARVSGPVVHSEDPNDINDQVSTTSSETLQAREAGGEPVVQIRPHTEPLSPEAVRSPGIMAIHISTELSDFPSHDVYSVLLPRRCGIVNHTGIQASSSLVLVTVKFPIVNDKFEIMGGNHTGIFVSKIHKTCSVTVGDQIKEIIYTPNEIADPVVTSLEGCTLDEVHRRLSEEFIRRRKEREVKLRLKKSQTEYDIAVKWIVENGGTGDFFYIRCNYEKRETTQKQSVEETNLRPGEIFLVRDTRCDEKLWAGYKINEVTGDMDSQLTKIYNKNWSYTDDLMRAKRKLATLVRAHLDDHDEGERRHHAFKVKGQVYERVLPMKASVKLPVILFGPDVLVEAMMDLIHNNLGTEFTVKKPGENADPECFELYRLDSHSVWKGKLDRISSSQKHIQKIIFLLKIASQDAIDGLRCIFGPSFSMTLNEDTIKQGTYLKDKLTDKGYQIEEMCFPELTSKDVLLSKFQSCVHSSQDRILWLSKSEMDSSVAEKYLTYLGPDLSTVMMNLQTAQSFDQSFGSDP